MKTLDHKHSSAVIIPRTDHKVSRRYIHPCALQVLHRLREEGFAAYLVGGSVRDLLLDLHPKDFDVATDAYPEQVRKLFTNSRLIGRRFRIVHVFSGRTIVEVTTFRKAQADAPPLLNGLESIDDTSGILCHDNNFGSIEEDALRRDFTINALYYNIADCSVVDFMGGADDLAQRVLRLIGLPEIRFREDPVRMLRAVRFAAKLNFRLDPAITEALPKMNSLLAHVPKPRVFDEFIKILLSGQCCAIFELMLQYDLLQQLMPTIPQVWQQDNQAEAFAKLALINTDQRVAQGKSINPAFMLAVLYWPIMLEKQQQLTTEGQSKGLAFDSAGLFAIERAFNELNVPRRFSATMRDIWYLQRRFSGPRTKRLLLVLDLPKFRAGYDFLLLRAEIEAELKPLADWWTRFYEADEQTRLELVKKTR